MMSSDGIVSLQDRVFLDSQELKQPTMSTASGNSSEPKVPPDSPGSSVSSRLQVFHAFWIIRRQTNLQSAKTPTGKLAD